MAARVSGGSSPDGDDPGDPLSGANDDEGWILAPTRSRRKVNRIQIGGGHDQSKGWVRRNGGGGSSINSNPGVGGGGDEKISTGDVRKTDGIPISLSRIGGVVRNIGGSVQVRGVPRGGTRSIRQQDQLHGKTSPWSFAPCSTAKSWKDICVHGRSMEDNCKLSYVSPSISSDGRSYAKIFRSEINETIAKWSNTLVGYVLGDRPYYLQLKASVTRMWKPTCSLEIFSRDNGYFFFRFGSMEECDRILQSGPWLFDGRLIILKKWTEDIGLDRDLLSSAPVWIRFPFLHLKLWSQSIISKLASLIGIPLFMDKSTAAGDRLSYARCFVEIDASKPLPRSVFLEVEEGDKIEVQVEFEWVPPICKKCSSFGHQDIHCPVIQVWKPKEKIHATANHNGNMLMVQHSVGMGGNSTANSNSNGETSQFNDSIEKLANDLSKSSATQGPISGVCQFSKMLNAPASVMLKGSIAMECPRADNVEDAQVSQAEGESNHAISVSHDDRQRDPNYVLIEECCTDSGVDEEPNKPPPATLPSPTVKIATPLEMSVVEDPLKLCQTNEELSGIVYCSGTSKANGDCAKVLLGPNHSSVSFPDTINATEKGNVAADLPGTIHSSQSISVQPPAKLGKNGINSPRKSDIAKGAKPQLFKGMFAKTKIQDRPQIGNMPQSSQFNKSDGETSDSYFTNEDGDEDDEPDFPLTMVNPEWQRMMENIETRKKEAKVSKGRKGDQLQITRKSVRSRKANKWLTSDL